MAQRGRHAGRSDSAQPSAYSHQKPSGSYDSRTSISPNTGTHSSQGRGSHAAPQSFGVTGGQTASGQGVRGQAAPGRGAHGQAAGGHAAQGRSAYGQDSHAQAAPGRGAHGQMPNAQPAHGQVSGGHAAERQSSFGQTAYMPGVQAQMPNTQAAYGQASNGRMAQGQGAYGAYGQGAYGQGVSNQASYGQAGPSAYVPAGASAPSHAHQQQEDPQSSKKKGKRGPVFYIALVVLILSLAALAFIAFSYWSGNNDYQNTAKNAAVDVEGKSLADMTLDWDALRAINPDICAWIYIPDTAINYPVCHTDNNDYYLNHSFNQNQGLVVNVGCIFLEANNTSDFSDKNNVLYGHNMNDGSMFGAIEDLVEQEVFDAHRTVYILTPQGNYQLRTFAYDHVEATEEIVQTQFSTDESYTAYVQDKMDRSVVTVSDNPSASAIKKSFMLSTCDTAFFATDKRYILCAYIEDTTVERDKALATKSGTGQVSTTDMSQVVDSSNAQMGNQ